MAICLIRASARCRSSSVVSGRSEIAYIQPAERHALGQGVGRIVGIVGGERQDLSRRIKIVTPYRFEIDLTEEIDQDD